MLTSLLRQWRVWYSQQQLHVILTFMISLRKNTNNGKITSTGSKTFCNHEYEIFFDRMQYKIKTVREIYELEPLVICIKIK